MSQYSEKGEDLKTKKEVNHKTGSLGEKKLLEPREKKKNQTKTQTKTHNQNNNNKPSRKYPEVKIQPRSLHAE